jgi:hypothetical protein
LLLLAPCAWANEIEGQLAAVADTGLYEISPTNNLGAVTEVPAGVHGGAKRSRYLIRFAPESVLPPDAEIVAAELKLRVATANAGAVNYGLHRMRTNWVEGIQGGSNGSLAGTNETTWLARGHPDLLWTAPGGAPGSDYESVATLEAVFQGGNTNVVLSSAALAADVQGWLDYPDRNFGWMLKAVDESVPQTVRRIVSREATNNVPQLLVRYVPGPWLGIAAVTNDLLHVSFTARPGRAYRLESRAVLAAGDWPLRTNIAAQPTAVLHVFPDIAGTNSQFYRVTATAP